MSKVKLTIAAKNQGDGSIGVKIFGKGKRKQALEWLNRTEEDLEKGSPYDDGVIEEVEVDLENGTFVEFDGI